MLTVETEYHGHHLYIQNPVNPFSSKTSFCVEKVVVNGKEREFENASAFVILLDTNDFKLGDSLDVKIYHKEGCLPVLLNTHNYKPIAGYELKWIKINETGLLTWETTRELNKFPYKIEQFRWNKWITIGEVYGKGSYHKNNYEYQVVDLHSGENKFRIKQIDYTEKPNTSQAVTMTPYLAKITYEINREKGVIEFSRATLYEIYDEYGNVVSKGFGMNVKIPHERKKTKYYLHYDNEETKFSIKPEKQ